jgi:peptidoglycan/LPS O-acetylase OafA/YrhL
MPSSTSSYSDSKSHYLILDGLRGVAALVVVAFHVLEIFAAGDHKAQMINHGYLAVDFFFLLSGYVIGYAYDDRWGRMSLWNFFKRRLIRLQPMIVMGMLIGGALYYFGAGGMFPIIAETPIWKMVVVMLVGMFLIPVTKSWDIRGWDEMYPLNGPAWTLFFEYIGNLLYALFVRKLSNFWLGVLVFASGGLLIHMAISNPHGDIIGGWALNTTQMHIGLSRLLFPFFAGLLMSRVVTPGKIKNAFLWCSLLLVVVLAFPRVGGDDVWINALYDSLMIILVFPLIVYMGASGDVTGKISQKLARFLGDISYPIYITHYSLIYLYYAWIVNNAKTFSTSWLMGVVVFFLSILLAYLSLKLYDEPIRKFLAKRFLASKK